MEGSLQSRSVNWPLANQTMITIGTVVVIALIFGCVVLMLQYSSSKESPMSPYLRFMYASFLKPHTSNVNEGQQGALESFYSAQASVYDATRKRLLRGREDMLGLIAAQLQARAKGFPSHKPVWYDIGGGTGYNIEVMDRLIGVQSYFEHVYLIDLSPSLCAIAEKRAKQLGWKNVTILCQDARSIQHLEGEADLLTMSYSLSMIPDFYSVVDLLPTLLKPDGIIGICDFYVQSIVDVSSRNYTGGVINRHVNWFGRMFWRTWFDADRVNLDAGRRDYVEYRFGTILSVSERNYLLGGIPYYIFIGCRRDAGYAQERTHESIEKLDAALTESPYLAAKDYRKKASSDVGEGIIRSKSYESAIINLTSNLPLPASFYQQHHWRLHYNDLLPKHQQFNQEYIYAFNWEDPIVDRNLLDINKDDVILTITSAGDNILDYLLESPGRIHAVDLNPNQNHLLELKCAAFSILSHSECWNLFAEGSDSNFRELLIHKLSPHLSSHAFQYWLSHTSAFNAANGGLFNTGGSRHAINLVRWLFQLFGLTAKVRTLCTVDTLNEQREIWPGIRDVLLSWPLHRLVVSTEWWSWKAAGVPREQRALIIDDFQAQQSRADRKTTTSKENSGEAIWKYIVDTLDPVVEHTQISRENYFYYVCLQGKYSKRCHPRYLTPKSHAKLSKPNAFDNLRIHTDELMEVISRLSPSSLTIAILMDSMDWFTPPPRSTPSTPEILAKHLHVKSSLAGSTSSSSSSSAAISTSNQPAQKAESKTQSQSQSKSTHGPEAASRQIAALHRVLKPNGRVLFRSASIRPWYVDIFEDQGFRVECVGKRIDGACIDRVNMYASTWICTRLGGEEDNDDDGRLLSSSASVSDVGRGRKRTKPGGNGKKEETGRGGSGSGSASGSGTEISLEEIVI